MRVGVTSGSESRLIGGPEWLFFDNSEQQCPGGALDNHETYTYDGPLARPAAWNGVNRRLSPVGQMSPELTVIVAPSLSEELWDAFVGLVDAASPLLDPFLDAIRKNPDQAGSVGAPGTWESFIPIWGSARAAVNDWQNGNYGWAIFDGAMAITDIFLAKALVSAGGKLLLKGGQQLLAREAAEVAAKGGAEVATKEGFGAMERLMAEASQGAVSTVERVPQKISSVFPSFGAARPNYRVIQTGGHTVSPAAAQTLNETLGHTLHPREWGRALERLKKGIGIPKDHHGLIDEFGNYWNNKGDLLGNLEEWLH